MISKSLEYVRKRIEEGNCRNMPAEEFKDMYTIPFKSYFLEGHGDYMIIATRKNSDEVFADLTYESDSEFNYFITETCVCDGTLIFMHDLMTRILQKIGQLETFYTPAVAEITVDNVNDYKLHYYVGDFVANSYIVEPPNKDKRWMCDRFTVMLPVKFTIEKIR